MVNNEPLISVIVPVYNVEKYLGKCVSSILNQTYRNLEVLLVDDGATDSSGVICDELASLDSRVKVIHKANGGLSDARNAALDIMRGEYVTFVDSDDWVHVDYVKLMYENLKKEGCQIVSALYKDVYEDEQVQNQATEKKSVMYFNNQEGVKALLSQKYFTGAACCKMYDVKLWEEIRFPKGKLYEDVETIYKVFSLAKLTAFCNQVVYYYLQRRTSIVRNKFSVRKMDYMENCKLVLHDVQTRYPELETIAISRLLWAEIHILVHMDDRKKYNREHALLWSDIKRYRNLVLRSSECRLKNKLVIVLTYGGDFVLKIFFRMSKLGGK